MDTRDERAVKRKNQPVVSSNYTATLLPELLKSYMGAGYYLNTLVRGLNRPRPLTLLTASPDLTVVDDHIVSHVILRHDDGYVLYKLSAPCTHKYALYLLRRRLDVAKSSFQG